MKLLKVFGIVVGIHVFALILIFANPGCSSTSQPAPSPSDTVSKADPAPASVSVPTTTVDSPVVTAPVNFDPNAPAVSVSAGIRYSPTRPGTAAANVLEAEPVTDVTPASTYTVGKGDSLWTIAKKNHLTVSELAAANNLKPGSAVRVGQKLIVPGKSATAAAPAPKSTDLAAAKAPAAAPATHAAADSVKHTVKAGETLGAIARKYQVKMGDIATANNIADPAKIHPGMELVIPGWQAPPAKTAKATTKGSTAAPAPTIPTISISTEEAEAKPASDAPPVISVEDVPAPKKF